jgi:hypothetical protein
MNRLSGRAIVAVAFAVALALPLAGCGSTSSRVRSAAKPTRAPAALTAAVKGLIRSVERKDAAAVCSYFTPRGRAYIVADAHSEASCTQVLATDFKRGTEFKHGGSSLGYRPVGPAQVTRVQSYGATVIISYRTAVGRGATIPWAKTRSGWKVDRTG